MEPSLTSGLARPHDWHVTIIIIMVGIYCNMGESACECVIAFCEVVIQAVCLDYQENEESSK